MEFEVVRFDSSLLELVEELNEQSFEPSPFLTATYLEAWDFCFSVEREKLGIVGKKDGQLIGAGVFYRRSFPDAYVCLGGKSLSDRLGFAIRKGFENEFIRDFAGWIAAEGRFDLPFVINNLNCESPQCEVFLRLAEETDRVFVEETDVSPYIELPSSFDEYLSGLSGKQRHELRRKMRRCEEKLGGVIVDDAAIASEESLADAFEDFVRLHCLSNQRKANFWKGMRKKFFQEIVKRFRERGWLRLFFLRRKSTGEPVSSLMVFDYNGDFLLYNSGFNPSWKSASPGLTLVGMTIRLAIEEGKRRYDFLRGDEKYKFDLGGNPRGVFRVEISP